MKVICDKCGNVAHGTLSELINKGWSRAKIDNPVKRTLTWCPCTPTKQKVKDIAKAASHPYNDNDDIEFIEDEDDKKCSGMNKEQLEEMECVREEMKCVEGC